MKSYIIVIPILLSAVAVSAQSLNVSYQQNRTSVQLQQMPHQDVSAKGHDNVQHTFSCVPIEDVFTVVHVPNGEKLRGPEMSLVVVAGAKDNYHAVFALAELDKSIGNTGAFVCDKQDGKALEEPEGPVRLVVPSDKRPARWVRMLTSLDIQQARP